MSAVPKRKYDYDYGYNYEQEVQKQPVSKKRVIKKKKSNKLVLGAVYKVILLSAIFALSLAMIFNFARITEKQMKIKDMQDEIKLINSKIEMHTVSLEKINSIKNIENMAKSYLGMNYPTRKQTVFLTVDYTEEENTVENDEKNIFDFILSFIK